jgi:hypothetical protein
MSSLVETLYPLPDLRRTPISLLRWWESRRLVYNAAVGTAGLVTLATLSLSTLLLPASQLPPLHGLVIGSMMYGVMANVCYSLGWLVELLARLVWGPRAPRMGPLLFREGLIFSVGLTLLPILVTALIIIIRFLGFVLP